MVKDIDKVLRIKVILLKGSQFGLQFKRDDKL